MTQSAFNETFRRSYLDDSNFRFEPFKFRRRKCTVSVDPVLRLSADARNMCRMHWFDLYEICMWVWEVDHQDICCASVDLVPAGDGPLPPQSSGGESATHRQMKADCFDWLRSRGNADAKMERPYPGGRSDVASLVGRIAVECGNTEPRKIIDAVTSGWTVGWVPYMSSVRGLCGAQETHRPMLLFSQSGHALREIFSISEAMDNRMSA